MEITAFAPPAEAHARIAYALTEVMMLAMYSDQTHVGVPNSDSGMFFGLGEEVPHTGLKRRDQAGADA